MKSIEIALEKIVGQEAFKSFISTQLGAAILGGELPKFTLSAKAGTGKTHAFRVIEEILGNEGFRVEIIKANECRLLDSEGFTTILDCIENPTMDGGLKGTLVLIDEAHLLWTAGTAYKDLANFILSYMDGGSKGRIVSLRGKSVVVNHKVLSFGLASNKVSKIDDAIVSRLNVKTLESYSVDEMLEIVKLCLEKYGIKKACDDTLLALAKSGKGTARNVETLVTQLAKICLVRGKNTVNQADVLQAMRDGEIYPQGFEKNEFETLEALKVKARTKAELAFILGLEDDKASLNDTLSFLMSKSMIEISRSKFHLAKRGNQYLESVKNLGFRSY